MVNTVQKLLIILCNPLQIQLKQSQKKKIQKTAEATGNLIDNEIADKIKKVLRTSP